MRLSLLTVTKLISLLFISFQAVSQEKRLALVVGIKDYNKAEARLTNPVNDADDMAKALEEVGFEVIKKTNLNRIELEKAINEFGDKLTNYEVGLFYYSGHGIQYKNENYLVPKDANMTMETQVAYQCVNLGNVLSIMEGAQTKTNLIILDACRDAPFRKSWASRSSNGGGLTFPNNPAGSLTIFATGAGSTAADNPGERNGLFTSELLKNIKIPNISLNQILINTKKGVYDRSSGNQFPAEYNQLLGEFYFIKKAIDTGSIIPVTPSQTPTQKPIVEVNRSKYISLQGNTYKMGLNGQSLDERPAHDVKVDNFWIAKYEVTINDWKEFCKVTNKEMPRMPDWELSPNAPIVGVSWYDAIEYCNWLSIKENLNPCYEKIGKEVKWDKSANGYRLPTEAEWEFAARGGKQSKAYIFAGSNDPNTVGWYNENSESNPHKVGEKQPNELGLFDMSGNVWEWCWDWYNETYYRNSPQSNPVGPESGSTKVLRGGSWLTNDTRVTIRTGYMPTVTPIDCGFRIVKNQ